MKENTPIQVALALSAASALIYEIVVTNVLFFYFSHSSYSMATVLSTFLLGLAIGSYLVYWQSHKIKRLKLAFGVSQIFVAIYAFFILTNLQALMPGLSEAGTFTASVVILLVPTIFLGATFPLAGLLFKTEKKEKTGLIYSSDLVGAISGSLIAGFFLIPMFGHSIAVLFGVSFNALSAMIILSGKYKLIPVYLGFAFVATSVLVPGIVMADTDTYEFCAPSPYGLVMVIDNALYINGYCQCRFDWTETRSEKMMVNYSLEHFSGDNPSVLNIGLGCGSTIERALEFGSRVDVVEINPQVVKANRMMCNILDNSDVNLIVDDGLHYLRNTDKKYDSVLIDVENPKAAHCSFLYTVDAFEAIDKSLNDNGTFALWNFNIKCPSCNNKYLDVIYYSMKEVFPFVYVYDWVTLGSKECLGEENYTPTSPIELNTIDRGVLEIYYGQ